MKIFFDGVPIRDGEVFTEETLGELTNGLEPGEQPEQEGGEDE